jgi:diketogulonate reductase-like aldo/keto reductase
METRVMFRRGGRASHVVVLGQGTWQMERDRRDEAIAAIRRGIDLGMTHIDTAELYGSGAVEELVAEAIAGRRDELFLVSKVLPHNASETGTVAACERSLKRLKTDRLDLYLLHWPGNHPIEGTIAAFTQLVREGKIRAWGVSNFDVLYHLKERAIEHEVVPFCEAHGIAVVGYSPFGSGDFPSGISSGGRVLVGIAARYRVSPRAVALRFLVRRQSLFTIPKSSQAKHVEDNARADDLTLSDDDIRRIDAAYPLGKPGRGLPTL